MYKKLIAIDCAELSFSDIQKFLSNYSAMVFSGQGSKGNFVKNLKLKESDSLKVLLGVPDTDMTTGFQQIMETAFAFSYGLDFGAHPEIWTSKPNLSVTNSNASTCSDLANVALDLEFIKSFGFRTAVWENEILHTRMQSYRDRIDRGQDVSSQNFKLMMALAIFGFSDPYQFFTDLKNVI